MKTTPLSVPPPGRSWFRPCAFLAVLIGVVAGQADRVANTTLTIPVRPQWEDLVVEPAFPQLEPVTGTGAALAPGDTNRIFVLGKTGRLYVINDLDQPTLSVFLDLTPKVYSRSESGLLGLAFHPGWRTNQTFFVYYSTELDDGSGTRALYQRLSRFLIDPAHPDRALPESEVPLISQKDPDDNHNGGDLEFGPDGYLYVSLGDGGGAFDTYKTTQRFHNDFFSGILRLDVDRRPGNLEPNPHPAIHPGTYFVPADNPLLGRTMYYRQPIVPDLLRSEFYAIGLRNPFRMAFDPRTGRLYANDVGQNRREEINEIISGGNYGWIFYEGSLAWPFGLVNDPPYTPPLYEYEHEGGRIAITGGAWYHGDLYPELKNSYVFADLGGPIGSMKLDESGNATVRWIARWPNITDVTVHPVTGEILFTTLNESGLAKLVFRRQTGPPIPTWLSETGIFADLNSLRPHPGIEPYDINVPFWSDHAHKQRWFSLPHLDQAFRFSDVGPWEAPEGALWIKHFDLETVVGEAASRRRIETRVLMRSGNGLWGATYRWNLAQSDAELVPATGQDELIPVRQGDQVHLQKWHYPSRDECSACHHAAAGGLLGFNTAQLNRDVLRAGQNTNQLQALIAAGYIGNPPEDVESLPVLAPADAPQWSLDYRVHSYLVANCAYCHQPGGPTRATWDGRLQTPLNESGLVGTFALNNLEDIFGIEQTYLVSPGDAQLSAVYRRVSELGPTHMPPLSTSELDQSAIQILGQWITNDLPTRMFTYQMWSNSLAQLRPELDLRPEADPDGDQFSNEMEFLLGESPENPVRAWQPAVLGPPGNWRLRFIRKANVRFQVQWSTQLADGWRPVEHPSNRWFVGREDELVELPLPSSSEACFYRIVIAGP